MVRAYVKTADNDITFGLVGIIFGQIQYSRTHFLKYGYCFVKFFKFGKIDGERSHRCRKGNDITYAIFKDKILLRYIRHIFYKCIRNISSVLNRIDLYLI